MNIVHHAGLDLKEAEKQRGGRRLSVLVTSAGRRVALLQAFRRGAHSLGIDLELLACDHRPDWSAACRMADAAFAVPRADTHDYVDAIETICAEHGVNLVVPTIDPELKALSLARDRLAAIGAEVAVSAPELIDIARDKLATADFLAANDIPVPGTAPLGAICADPSRLNWPLILKPRHGSAGRAITIARTPADLPASEDEPMIAQELLRGEEWTVNLYFDRNGRLRATVPHQRVQVRAGEVEKGVTRRVPALAAIAGRMAACLPAPRGVLCYQAMIAPEGTVSVFEINARFGGGYPLADHAGASFARWLLEERLGLPSSASDSWTEGVAMLRFDAAVFVAP